MGIANSPLPRDVLKRIPPRTLLAFPSSPFPRFLYDLAQERGGALLGPVGACPIKGNEAYVPAVARHVEIEMRMITRRLDGVTRLGQERVIGGVDEERGDGDVRN